MKRINISRKGSQGERQCAKWLADVLQLDEIPKRNLEQVRSGGHDLQVADFVFEVKGCQTLNFREWWVQIVTASKRVAGSEPVVIYRSNTNPWRILISAKHIGLMRGYIRLGSIESKLWLIQRYEEMGRN